MNQCEFCGHLYRDDEYLHHVNPSVCLSYAYSELESVTAKIKRLLSQNIEIKQHLSPNKVYHAVMNLNAELAPHVADIVKTEHEFWLTSMGRKPERIRNKIEIIKSLRRYARDNGGAILDLSICKDWCDRYIYLFLA